MREASQEITDWKTVRLPASNLKSCPHVEPDGRLRRVLRIRGTGNLARIKLFFYMSFLCLYYFLLYVSNLFMFFLSFYESLSFIWHISNCSGIGRPRSMISSRIYYSYDLIIYANTSITYSTQWYHATLDHIAAYHIMLCHIVLYHITTYTIAYLAWPGMSSCVILCCITNLCCILQNCAISCHAFMHACMLATLHVRIHGTHNSI